MVFHDLPNEAAHGITCVHCGDDFLLSGTASVDVGISATTGETVRAHPGSCASAAARAAEAGEQLVLGAGR